MVASSVVKRVANEVESVSWEKATAFRLLCRLGRDGDAQKLLEHDPRLAEIAGDFLLARHGFDPNGRPFEREEEDVPLFPEEFAELAYEALALIDF